MSRAGDHAPVWPRRKRPRACGAEGGRASRRLLPSASPYCFHYRAACREHSFSFVLYGAVFCSCLSCCCSLSVLAGVGQWPPSAPDQLALSSRRAPLRQGSCCAPASLRRTPAGFVPYG
ncbi:hypothetical protein CSY59_18055 [Salmonella enterica]|nr:hypothetical protein [Salmonella enterica]EBE5915025.1 hypothetical protein [Salmonella enterica]EDZ0950068.1 hypothetical protein [Salmonella enterica]